MKFVIVGFRVDEEKSVYYAKAKSLEELAKKMAIALTEKNAQFLSIRHIPANSVGNPV